MEYREGRDGIETAKGMDEREKKRGEGDREIGRGMLLDVGVWR